MHFGDYQNEATDTAIYPGQGDVTGLAYAVLGLTGESGEIANKVKKVLRGDKDLATARKELHDELGDVLWYIAAIATELDLNLDLVALDNLEKLRDRQQRDQLTGDGDTR